MVDLECGDLCVGWIIQFIGHYYEKKKPAFMDDVIGLAIGPLFVLAEFVFLLGFRKELEQRMLTEARRQRAEMDAKALHTAHP
jgi:Predicted membrane protein